MSGRDPRQSLDYTRALSGQASFAFAFSGVVIGGALIFSFFLLRGTRCGAAIFLCACASWLCSAAGHAAGTDVVDTIQRDQLDRSQQLELQREQRRLDDTLLPGVQPSLPAASSAALDGGPCFQINTVQFQSLSPRGAALAEWLGNTAQVDIGHCLSLADIQLLQRDLSNALMAAGFITSRVLIPEQNLSSGALLLQVVAGYVEDVTLDGLSARRLHLALPERDQALLNLRDLEQAMENLQRLPGMEASFDLLPGKENGGSQLAVTGRQPKTWQSSLSVTEKIYGSVAHGTINTGVQMTSPLGLTDRVIVYLNTDIDRAISDTAQGIYASYDVAFGYWLLELSGSYQAYKNEVKGNLTSFDTDGHTGNTTLDVSRVLYRNGVSRFTAGVYTRYDDISNRIDDITIGVSSYRLDSAGVRVDMSKLVGVYQLGGSVSLETARASGSATQLLNNLTVADERNQRVKVFASVLRTVPALNSTARLQVSAQHSDDRLFPVQRQSLTATVQGYEDIARSGNSAATATLEWSLQPRIFAGTSIRPFIAPQVGWVLANNQAEQSARLAAWVAGVSLAKQRMGLTMDIAWPWDRASNATSENEYVFRAALNVSY